MTQIPTLAQLLKQAIDNRLLDMHTALIARVESYDSSKQQVNVSPVFKRSIENVDQEIILEQLPMLCDVPVLFPRAGGFFISFPIQAGDFVQLIFNEVSIDDWMLDKATTMSSTKRFTLQGAVAIPGIYPESSPLSNAHEKNFVAGKDNGVQLHIDKEKIRLGSAEADEALAIASKVKEELNKLRNSVNAHTHASFGDPPKLMLIPPAVGIVSSIQDIATKKVVAE